MSDKPAQNVGPRDLQEGVRPSQRKLDPATRRLQRRVREKPPYKVIAIGIYDDLAQSLDRTASGLQQAGYFKANRSFVVQVLVRRLQQDIEGKGPDEILNLFIEKYLRRPLAAAPSREQQPLPSKAPPRTRRHARGLTRLE